MPERKELLGIPAGVWIIAIAIIVVLTFPYWSPFLIEEPAVEYKYQTGLTAKFKIMDDTSSALVTANMKIEVFPSDIEAEDVYSKTFITKALTVASYDSVLGSWIASLDAGSYNILLTDTQGTQTRYPAYTGVVVPGTDNEEKEVWAEPSTLHINQRATETISKDIKAWNVTGSAYDISVSTINYTLYDKWRVTITFTPSGDSKYMYPGRVYFTEFTGLSAISASVDGQTASALLDKDASEDGLTGYYVEYTGDWLGGEVHTVVIVFDDAGTTLTAGTMTVRHTDFYAVHRDTGTTPPKWWTYYSTTITVEA